MKTFIVGAIFIGGLHLLLITASLVNITRSTFKTEDKVFWYAVVFLVPVLGVLIFHMKHKLGWWLEKPYELSVQEAIARSQTGGGDSSGID